LPLQAWIPAKSLAATMHEASHAEPFGSFCFSPSAYFTHSGSVPPAPLGAPAAASSFCRTEATCAQTCEGEGAFSLPFEGDGSLFSGMGAGLDGEGSDFSLGDDGALEFSADPLP
jgi:hypothetical protein